jgi:hypothetical protein
MPWGLGLQNLLPDVLIHWKIAAFNWSDPNRLANVQRNDRTLIELSLGEDAETSFRITL